MKTTTFLTAIGWIMLILQVVDLVNGINIIDVIIFIIISILLASHHHTGFKNWLRKRIK